MLHLECRMSDAARDRNDCWSIGGVYTRSEVKRGDDGMFPNKTERHSGEGLVIVCTAPVSFSFVVGLDYAARIIKDTS
jgi:hypothetical protein